MKYRANRTQCQASLIIDEMPPILCKKNIVAPRENSSSFYLADDVLLTVKVMMKSG